MKYRKIRNLMITFLISGMMLPLSSCGKKNDSAVKGGHAASSTTGVNDLLQSGLDEQTSNQETTTSEEVVIDFTSSPAYTSSAPLPSEEVIPTFTMNEEGVEVDLTVLSSGAVYSIVYDMMMHPDNYVGKVVKMRGLFDTAYDEANGIRYYACVIQDATQCCAQGIEFELENPGTYPDDFPQVGQECTVIGVFDTYMEGEYMYATLRKSKMTITKEG